MHIYHHHTVHLCNCSHPGNDVRRADASATEAPRAHRPVLGGLLELARLAAIFALSPTNERLDTSRDTKDSTALDSHAVKPVSRDEGSDPDAVDAAGPDPILAMLSQAAAIAGIDDKDKPSEPKPPLSLMDAFLAAFRDDPTLA